MKLILAMVSNEDASKTVEKLSVNQFYVTRLNTAGQFLRSGNTTLLSGVEDDRVDALLAVLKECTSVRTVESKGVQSTIDGSLLAAPIEVTKGGATVFVLDVDRFHKL
ncbi:MAG: cyclic-di-AMP receptor [Clostridiales bacterium]|nr:cyclic-di-AMP receptor [Clostridiales bacterium]